MKDTAKTTIVHVGTEALPTGHGWMLITRKDDGPVLAFIPDAVTLPEVMGFCKTLGIEFDSAVRMP